jgi:SAM-dependent methyltransferase
MTDQDRIIENYRRLLVEHGSGPAVGQWSEEGQRFRFAKLATIAPLGGKTVLDVGCGIGDFYPFLTQLYGPLSYTGIDIVPQLIERATLRFPDAEFECVDLLSDPLAREFDYGLLSGVFNNAMTDATEFLFRMITAAFARCTQGFGFNFVSSYVNYRGEDMAHHDPVQVLDFCLNNLTRKVVMAHHYERCDVAVFLYR